MSENKKIKEVLLQNGLLEDINGNFISAAIIARIIPNRKNGTAVCKDKVGNRIAILRWPKE
ncbi:MAG: hypothetical protein ACXW1U_20850 [Methylobacter sp.]